MTVQPHPTLVSRQAPPVANLPAVASSTAAEQLDVELRRAKAIAAAGDVLPRAYRDRPGAILLADQWAQARGLDTLTAIQTVSFIDGRPVVDATMQRALAERAGYDVRVVEATNTQATVVVLRGGRELGRETFTLDDAKRQGLTAKSNWQKTPRNMLVARATTNALRFFAPSVVVGLGTEDDYVADHVDVLTEPAAPADQPEHVEPEAQPAGDDDVVDAELVDDTPAAPDDEPEPEQAPWTVETLRTLMAAHSKSLPVTLRHVREIAGDDPPASLRQLLDQRPDLVDDVVAWITGQLPDTHPDAE